MDLCDPVFPAHWFCDPISSVDWLLWLCLLCSPTSVTQSSLLTNSVTRTSLFTDLCGPVISTHWTRWPSLLRSVTPVTQSPLLIDFCDPVSLLTGSCNPASSAHWLLWPGHHCLLNPYVPVSNELSSLTSISIPKATILTDFCDSLYVYSAHWLLWLILLYSLTSVTHFPLFPEFSDPSMSVH